MKMLQCVRQVLAPRFGAAVLKLPQATIEKFAEQPAL
jgi:hypothetical protein